MVRWYLILLPLCLLLQDRPTSSAAGYIATEPQAVAVIQKQVVFKNQELARQEILAGMVFATSQSFPAAVPWAPMQEIGSKGLYTLDYLLHYHPLLFLEMSLARYKHEVRGYTTRFLKRERIGGTLNPPESLDVWFRQQPFSVLMIWLDGTHKSQKALYVAGENNGKLLARGAGYLGLAGIWTKDINDAEAKRNGLYTIDQFGIGLGTERTVASMKRAKERGTLHLIYEGIFEVPQLGNRACYKFVRTPYEPIEEEGINELTLYFDRENWLQVGSILKDSQGKLIAEYYFRDLKLNPEFKKDQFTRAAL